MALIQPAPERKNPHGPEDSITCVLYEVHGERVVAVLPTFIEEVLQIIDSGSGATRSVDALLLHATSFDFFNACRDKDGDSEFIPLCIVFALCSAFAISELPKGLEVSLVSSR